MQNKPSILTAIPKQRIQLGEYLITILSEVETNDPLPYQYIAAFVEEGKSEPVLYVTCERMRRAGQGRYRIRLINEAMKEVLDQADELGELPVFVEQAIDIGKKVLSLSDEVGHQIL